MASFLLVRPEPRFFDLFLLLFNQESLHRVIIVVISHQQCQLLLFRQRWSPCFFLAALVLLGVLPFFLQNILPADFELFGVLIVSGFVPGMVDSNRPFGDLCAAEVVDCQVGTTLVFVLEPPKALGLAGLLVAGEFQECRIAELREDCDNIALRELEW